MRDDVDQEFDKNRRRFSDEFDPLNDFVALDARPTEYTSILTDTAFARPGWALNFSQKGDRYFYLEGVGAALRIFSEPSLRFLKDGGFLDLAASSPELRKGGTWARQSGLKLDRKISPSRIVEAKDGVLIDFHVGATLIVALELALRDSGEGLSPYWPYEYIRLRPAVYGIMQFTSGKLAALREHDPNFDVQAMSVCLQHKASFLDELAAGGMATYRTVKRLKRLIDRIAENEAKLKVLEIIYDPYASGENKSLPCPSELV